MRTHLLIVEDDLVLQGLYRGLLAPLGVELAICSTYESGLSEVVNENFDLALFDVNLGNAGLEGLKLLDASRRHHPGTPVVLMSTFGKERLSPLVASEHDAVPIMVEKDATFIDELRQTVEGLLAKARTAAPAGLAA